MRKILPLLLMLMLTRAADAAQPVYELREHPEVTVESINAQTKRIGVKYRYGFQSLSILPKTWLIKDGEEASFKDLKVGQHVRVWYIPRGGQVVAIEILRSE